MMGGEGLLIVVPARGGSKGLPRKNTRKLGDIPLLGWTAEAVKHSGLNKAICLLSTDDPEIADIGRSVGFDVPFLRPAELATDTATAESVALHALDWLESTRGHEASSVMWLQPTSPFRTPDSIKQAVAMLINSSVTGVLGVKPLHRSLKTLFYPGKNMELMSLDQQGESITRRQDAKTLYTPNGTLYLVRSRVLRDDRSFFPAGCQGIVMDQIASLDIDDPVDWNIAEAVVAARLTWRN